MIKNVAHSDNSRTFGGSEKEDFHQFEQLF